MNLFHIIEDAQVILRSKGTFYRKKVYLRGKRLYAAWAGGFIRLCGGDATSNPNVSWEELDGVVTTKGELGAPYVD